MKLETTYENNNYPIIVEHDAIEYLDSFTKDYDKVFFIIDANVYHQFSEKIDTHMLKYNSACLNFEAHSKRLKMG